METVERIKAEVERLRDTKGIPFNEMVCYVNVLRIIEREILSKPFKKEIYYSPISTREHIFKPELEKLDLKPFWKVGFDKEFIKGDKSE